MLPVILAVLAILAVFWSLRRGKRKTKNNYPPIAGTVLHQFLNLHRLLDFHTEISRRHKTFRMLTPTCNYVYTVDPQNVEYILRTNFSNYGKGSSFYEVTCDLIGDGIFGVDGDKWRQQRKLASFEFSAKVLREFSSVVFASTATKLVGIIAEYAKSNKPMEIQDLFMRSTMDSIFKVGFGLDLDTLSGFNREGLEFAKAFDNASALLLRRFFDLSWKIQKLLNVGPEYRLRKDVKQIDDFIFKIIDKKIKQQQALNNDDSMMKKGDILSRFLVEREKDPETMSLKYIRDIILNFVIAGRDTTAGTLSWFFYMICKNPNVQEKAAMEIRKTIDDFSTPKSLTEEALNKMQYLHAAITETLRLYPAVPLDVKECFSDDTFPDGFDVRKGDMVNYQPYPMGRMSFLWGDDAEEFSPERWLDDDGIFQPANPFKFTAFQAGPRICLGKDFAYKQMKIFAAALLLRFKFKLYDDKKKVNYKTMLTLQIDGGIQLIAIPR